MAWAWCVRWGLELWQVQEVRGMLAPFVLRRLKAGVLKQLVAKTERLEMVPLSKVGMALRLGDPLWALSRSRPDVTLKAIVQRSRCS